MNVDDNNDDIGHEHGGPARHGPGLPVVLPDHDDDRRYM